VTITPAAGQVVVNSVDPALTLSTRSDAVHLDSDGLMRAFLVCTDDPDIEPHNSWTYSFRGDWAGSPTVTCPVPMVPVDPETGKMPPLNLSTAVSRASVSGVLITKGAPGDRGPGIASIDPDGTVHLDDGSTVTWDLPPAVADDAAVAELVASVSETAAAVDARVSSAVVDKLDEPAVDARVRAVGDGTYAPVWAATSVVIAGQKAMLPIGRIGTRKANGTTRATFDATEAAGWSYPSLVFSGAGAPSSDIPGAVTGDRYLDTATGDEYNIAVS
jgi:hypothetical protein